MSLKYVLALACCVTLAGLATAQTGSTLPRAKPVPITPVPTGRTQPIVPFPTSRTPPIRTNLNPPMQYPQYQQYPWIDFGRAPQLYQYQYPVYRQDVGADAVLDQYRDLYDRLDALNAAVAEQSARLQELNQLSAPELSATPLSATDGMRGAGAGFNNEQMLRYQRLNDQYGGFNPLSHSEIQRRLSLTPEQVRQLQDPVQRSNQPLPINNVEVADPTRRVQQFNEFWKQRQERINQLLTPEQQQLWREMIGEPITFQPIFTPPR